ncbi:MAG: hypothetical protein P1U65_01855 [Minwuia sp.]|nr:hypothetical protein [Minwuia sp.]
MRKLLVILALILFCAATVAEARELRRLNRIQTPDQSAALLPTGAVRIARVNPVPRAEVERFLDAFARDWNSGNQGGYVADDFVDRARLAENQDIRVPRDAVLKVQAVQGVQTLQQARLTADDGERRIVSTVSATVRTRIEFNDQTLGFVVLTGTNDFLMEFQEVDE